MSDARITDLGSWLRPTLLGPFVTLYGLVTVSHLALGGAIDGAVLLGQETDAWAVAMLIASFVASGIVVSLICADVALLAAKLRRLPTGFGAWLGGLLAPFALMLAWHLVPGQGESVLEGVLAFALPFPISALALRLVLGQKP